jgi:hypothetical protein
VAVLIVVVALCWVLRDKDRSWWLVWIIQAWRVGRARAARAGAKRWAAAQPDNGRGFAAGTPELWDRGTGGKRELSPGLFTVQGYRVKDSERSAA